MTWTDGCAVALDHGCDAVVLAVVPVIPVTAGYCVGIVFADYRFVPRSNGVVCYWRVNYENMHRVVGNVWDVCFVPVMFAFSYVNNLLHKRPMVIEIVCGPRR